MTHCVVQTVDQPIVPDRPDPVTDPDGPIIDPDRPFIVWTDDYCIVTDPVIIIVCIIIIIIGPYWWTQLAYCYYYCVYCVISPAQTPDRQTPDNGQRTGRQTQPS